MIMISKTIEIQICKQERKHTLLDNFVIQIVQQIAPKALQEWKY